ncbi:MAG TPA: hypothetical protein VFP68_08895 [Burkholderiaceae bacterium]|nr:hypothetical protein [Burkholderiaceae bacterium]
MEAIHAFDPPECPEPLPALPPGPARELLCEAMRALDEAEQGTEPFLLAQAQAEVGRCYVAVGAFPAAQWHLQRALGWSSLLGSVDLRVDLLCELAELAVREAELLKDQERPRRAHSARERARDRCYQASAMATRATDPHWEVHVLLRVSEVLGRCGDHDDALALQCRALHLLMQQDLPTLQLEWPGINALQ